MKIIFTDNSYIEENASGLIYVGKVANEVSHIIRKTNCSLKDFNQVYNKMLKEKVAELKASN